jgi:hypothetical protein
MENPVPVQERSKVLIAVIVVALLALVFVVDSKRKAVQDQLQNLTVRLEQLQGGNTQQNREAAQEIVRRVRKLIAIPEDVEPTVATVVDVETLRERNPFYDNAENGDHLVVTPERAILYDPDSNIILDVVPVQLQPIEGGQ